MRPIALLTDFGTRDPYVASMKGVIASRTAAPLHDLSHEIAPFDVWQAAFFLRDVYDWWPAGTIFVAVVDPGVGTSRRILAMERGGHAFLAPDNGLLTLIASERIVSVENEVYFLPQSSNTFHGRDRFAPVAAALANGASLDDLGPPAGDLVRLAYTPPVRRDDAIDGTIVNIDRFGNVITDIEAPFFPSFVVNVGHIAITRVARTYGEGGRDPFVIVGSTGCIEISVANDSAAALLHLRRGDRLTLRRTL